jgi:hypothetical protein
MEGVKRTVTFSWVDFESHRNTWTTKTFDSAVQANSYVASVRDEKLLKIPDSTGGFVRIIPFHAIREITIMEHRYDDEETKET